MATPILRQTTKNAPGVILAFWHSSLLLLPALWFWDQAERRRHKENHAKIQLNVLISRNRDGRLINDIIEHWGIVGIEGSTSRKGKDKGGARAFRRAVDVIRSRQLLAITPDGPRGPIGTVQPGALALARVTGGSVVPIGASCNAIHLPSWDRMALPLPFGRGEIFYGSPLSPESTAETLAHSLDDASDVARRRLSLGRLTWADSAWAVLGTILAPGFIVMLRFRLSRGREIRTRLRERMGMTRARRPKGPLLWIHAASVGECRSVLPLVDALLERRTDLKVLLTTATVTGAEIVGSHTDALPKPTGARVRHQFVPYDLPRWTGRFLRHWRPQAALLVESELWPGMIAACFRRGIRIAVVNGRLSERSWRRWHKMGRLARTMFARLDFVAARGPEDARHFTALGVSECHEFGDLKQSAPPPSADSEKFTALQRIVGTRPVFLAAATHPGEEEFAAEVAAKIREKFPNTLCIVVPRHPTRGADIAARLRHPPRRAMGAFPSAADPLWIADTLGEMGLFYRLATVAWMGNSLAEPGGGHNPFEPVRLGIPLASGPYVNNFKPAFEMLGDSVNTVRDASALAAWAGMMIADPALRKRTAEAATARIETFDIVPAPLLTRIIAMLPV